VVQLGGDDANENDDPNDPTQWPEIRVQGTPGSGGGSRSTNRRVRSGDDGVTTNVSPTTTQSSERPSALDPEARRAYDHAIELMNGKQHEKALEALNAFLVKWPDHPYAENAMYWRGEIFFAQREYLRAAEQFEAVLARFNGRKAPDALLKIGMCHDKLGAPSRANDYWARLKRDFPQSDAAHKIPKETR
jgi:tol-pal system protein YbgF